MKSQLTTDPRRDLTSWKPKQDGAIILDLPLWTTKENEATHISRLPCYGTFTYNWILQNRMALNQDNDCFDVTNHLNSTT